MRLCTLLLLVPVVVGCAKEPRPFFNHIGMEFDNTWVSYVKRSDVMFVVVWSDIANTDGDFGIAGGGGGTDLGQVQHVTTVHGGGRAMELKVGAGTNPTAVINGKEFRLEDGALFLVRTRAAGCPVTQVKRDLSGMPPGHETLRQMIDDHPEVKEFFARARSRD